MLRPSYCRCASTGVSGRILKEVLELLLRGRGIESSEPVYPIKKHNTPRRTRSLPTPTTTNHDTKSSRATGLNIPAKSRQAVPRAGSYFTEERCASSARNEKGESANFA